MTKGIDFRKRSKTGEVVKLPTGFEVTLRQVSLQALMRTGNIPTSLTSLMAEMVMGKLDTTDIVKAAMNAIELNYVICKESMLSPRIVDEPTGDDEIAFNDLTEEEVNFIVTWAQDPHRAMEAFRTEQTVNVGDLPNS